MLTWHHCIWIQFTQLKSAISHIEGRGHLLGTIDDVDDVIDCNAALSNVCGYDDLWEGGVAGVM